MQGDGSVKEVPGFSLGTSSYIPVAGRFSMLDMRSGKTSINNKNDESGNHAKKLVLNVDYTFDGGL